MLFAYIYDNGRAASNEGREGEEIDVATKDIMNRGVLLILPLLLVESLRCSIPLPAVGHRDRGGWVPR